FSGRLLHRDGVPGGDVLDSFEGNPGAYEFVGDLDLAARVLPALQLGVAVGRVASRLGEGGRIEGWSTNAGILWRAQRTRVGLAVRGFTSGLHDDRRRFPYRYRLSGGLAHSTPDERLLVSVQVDRDRGATAELGMGAEWWVPTGVALRLGMRTSLDGAEKSTLYSGGFGVRRDRLAADYALRVSGARSPEHVVSLHFQLGGPAPVGTGSVPRTPAGVPGRRAQSTSGGEPVAARPGRLDATTARGGPQPTRVAAPPQRTRVPEGDAALPRTPSGGPRTAARTSARQPAPPAASQRPAQSSPPQLAPAARPAVRGRAARTVPDVPRPRPALERGRPEATHSPQRGRFVVRSGVHTDMDSAALEVARFYRAKLRPRLERRGDLYVVVLRRCSTREEAHTWVEKAREAGLRCTVDEE
ncbi:MAG: hypothetical protein ACE5G2_01415, partial [Candidatus Krumholzibacteriia bacterium]